MLTPAQIEAAYRDGQGMMEFARKIEALVLASPEVDAMRRELAAHGCAPHRCVKDRLENALKWQERAIVALMPFADAYLDPGVSTHRITLHDFRLAFEARGVPFHEKKTGGA